MTRPTDQTALVCARRALDALRETAGLVLMVTSTGGYLWLLGWISAVTTVS